MALISSKGAYGLRAMYELSLSPTNELVRIKTIAQKSNISQNYLEQLLSSLRKAGLVESIRGAQGGYKLAKPANEITVYEVIDALEGDLEIVSQTELSDPLKLFYQECQKTLIKTLKLPLSELHNYHERLLGQLNYVI
jgi:Rrf2 family protein